MTQEWMFSPVLVHDYLSLHAKNQPDKIALICAERRYSYQALDQMSDAVAHFLGQIGCDRHSRVALFLDNCAEEVIAIYGTLKAGCTFVPLNGSLKAKKLAFILTNSGAQVLITHSAKARIVAEAFQTGDVSAKILWTGSEAAIPDSLEPISLNWTDIFSSRSLQNDDSIASQPLPRCIDIDLAALIYTSGSTGEPKGVMSSHQNMVAAARSIIQYLGNRSDDVIIDVLPLSFDYGLYQVIMAFMFGGTIVLEKSFLYLHQILERIAKEKVTGFPIVPTVLAMLLKMQDLSGYELGSLRYLSNTGAALPVEHIRKIRALLPQVQFFSMYGLTECKRVAYLPPEEIDHRPGSVGKAMPNCEVFVVDEQGQDVGPGEEGQLVIRGANVMRGYWKDPDLTEKVFRPGRWPGEKLLYSGDVFKKDEEGFLYFIGRKDDMIKCKAERVSAREVENTICEMPGIAEVCVIGVPDEIFGQAIKAFLVPSDGVQLSEKEVLKYCTEHLESFAVPKYVRFVPSLPKTPHGKIDRKLLMQDEV